MYLLMCFWSYLYFKIECSTTEHFYKKKGWESYTAIPNIYQNDKYNNISKIISLCSRIIQTLLIK